MNYETEIPTRNTHCPICQKRIGKRDLHMPISLAWDALVGHSFCVRFGRPFIPAHPSRAEMAAESAMLEKTGYGDRFEA